MDVAIVGAGLAGSLAAALLRKAGVDVALIDRRAVHPPEFRAEQLVGEQVNILERWGLLQTIVGDQQPQPRATAYCKGVVVDTTYAPHYGIAYADMVNRLRQDVLIDRVTWIDPSNKRQTIYLSDHSAIHPRLTILATGHGGQQVFESLGLERETLSDNHSMAFGFDMEINRRDVFVHRGEHPGDAIDYLTCFPMGDTMRANLFTYHSPMDAWVREFREAPKRVLLRALPGMWLHEDFKIVSDVQARPSPIRKMNGHSPGVVVIGDAYQTSCPAVGSGIGRLLNDVELIVNYALEWLKTPGMNIDKIDQFYNDPRKLKADSLALRTAYSRRAMHTRTNVYWRMRRAGTHYKLRLKDTLQRA